MFPLRMFGLQYADRKMLIRDVVREDGTRRRLTRHCGTQLDYPPELHPTAAGVGPHTLIFLRAYPEPVLSVLNLLPYSISPLTRCEGVVGCTLTLHTCAVVRTSSGIIVRNVGVAHQDFLCLPAFALGPRGWRAAKIPWEPLGPVCLSQLPARLQKPENRLSPLRASIFYSTI